MSFHHIINQLKMQKIILLSLWIILCFILTPQISNAQQTEVTQARFLGKTKALRDMPLATPSTPKSKTKSKLKKAYQMPNFENNLPMPTPFKDTAEPQNGDPLYQLHLDKNLLLEIEPILVFDGIDENASNVQVPDTNGDVSDEFYVQVVNGGQSSQASVWDKEGNLIQGPIEINALWNEFNIVGLGDPVILWDKEAGRWLVSEVGDFGTNIMLVAISETSDPLGNWMAYEIQSPELPDYPKYAIWGDSYLITTNETSSGYIPVYAIDRNAMINGEAIASVVRLEGMTKFGSNTQLFQVATPVTHVGSNPIPDGSPSYSVRIRDDAWDDATDAVEVWEAHVDWSNPDAATLVGPTIIPLAAFDSELCDGGAIFSCVNQNDGTAISVLQQVIMYRANYRNFGTHESIVLNFSVDVDGNNHAGIRWVELRKTGANDWGLYQEGTIAPDENHRFMGSINMDAAGNILVAYSVTGPSAELDLRVTGRLNGDPLGEMTITEYEFADGQGSTTTPRWGDYSAMSIDPSDDLTFWFTGEYMANTFWKTSIMNVLLRKDTFDIGIQALVSPANSGYLTAIEPVTIAIRNYGYEAAAGFNLSYSMDNGTLITEAFLDTIQPDSTKLYTFASTEDLSAIGEYNFKIYSSWAKDTAFYNDTLLTIVKQLPRNDAAVIGVEGTGGFACLDFFEGGIILQNIGVDTLTTATIEYQINANTPVIIEWTGSLATGETETVPVNSSDVVDGLNSISVTITLPNGAVDGTPDNNTIIREFSLLIESAVELEFQLLTDDYPAETSWDLKDVNGDIVRSGNGYTATQTEHIEYWCLAEGCYTFTIYDAYGDGLEYFGVEGDVIIRRVSDNVILFDLIDPSFGSELAIEICSDFECNLASESMVVNVSESGAADGTIMVNPLNGVMPLEYSIDNGGTWQTDNVFNNLEAGTHTILIRDGINCEVSIEIEVGTCTLMVSAEATAASTNGTTDGSITVTATNGGDGVEYSLDGNTYFNSNIFENLSTGEYVVYVQNADGCLQTLDVFVDATVGTKNTQFGGSVKILPNPTEGLFMVEVRGLNELSTLKIDILDTNGKILKTDRLVNYSGVLKNRLSLIPYPSGIYFLRIRNERFTHVVRVIKE